MRPVLMEPRGELDSQILKRVLQFVGVDVPISTAAKWTKLEKLIVYDWAWREHLHASDNPVMRRERPTFLPDPTSQGDTP